MRWWIDRRGEIMVTSYSLQIRINGRNRGICRSKEMINLGWTLLNLGKDEAGIQEEAVIDYTYDLCFIEQNSEACSYMM